MTKAIQHQCPECGGAMEHRTITHEERDERGVFYVFENVPAWVCTQCGHIYLEAEVDAKLDEIIKHGVPSKEIKTPVYDYAKTGS